MTGSNATSMSGYANTKRGFVCERLKRAAREAGHRCVAAERVRENEERARLRELRRQPCGAKTPGRDILVSATVYSDAAGGVLTMAAPAQDQEPPRVASALPRRSAGVGRRGCKTGSTHQSLSVIGSRNVYLARTARVIGAARLMVDERRPSRHRLVENSATNEHPLSLHQQSRSDQRRSSTCGGGVPAHANRVGGRRSSIHSSG